MMEIELILFDWGGTLAEVSRQSQALLAGAREVGRILGGVSDEEIAVSLAAFAMAAEKTASADPQHREVDLATLLGEWARSRGWPGGRDDVAAAVRAVSENWVGGALDPIPGAMAAVEQLRDRGYRMGLVSNCWIPPLYCRQELDRQGFASLMDFAVFSSAVAYRKPSRIIYEAALKEACSNGGEVDRSRVLFVGDSPSCDVMAPATMGMRTALVATNPGIWPQADYASARPDFRINAVAELPALL